MPPPEMIRDEGEDQVGRQRVGQRRDQVGAARRARGDKITGLGSDLGLQHCDPAGGEGLDVVRPDPGVLGRVAVGHGRGGTETLRQDLLGLPGQREDRVWVIAAEYVAGSLKMASMSAYRVTTHISMPGA